MDAADPLNLRILARLQEDARAPTTQIAEALRRSEATVRDRIRQLERKGVIQGYQARVEAARVGLAAKALVRAGVADYARVQDAARALAHRPHVTHVYRTTGRFPLAFVAVAEDALALEAAIQRDTRDLALADVEVDLVLATVAEAKALPLAEAALQRRVG